MCARSLLLHYEHQLFNLEHIVLHKHYALTTILIAFCSFLVYTGDFHTFLYLFVHKIFFLFKFHHLIAKRRRIFIIFFSTHIFSNLQLHCVSHQIFMHLSRLYTKILFLSIAQCSQYFRLMTGGS